MTARLLRWGAPRLQWTMEELKYGLPRWRPWVGLCWKRFRGRKAHGCEPPAHVLGAFHPSPAVGLWFGANWWLYCAKMALEEQAFDSSTEWCPCHPLPNKDALDGAVASHLTRCIWRALPVGDIVLQGPIHRWCVPEGYLHSWWWQTVALVLQCASLSWRKWPRWRTMCLVGSGSKEHEPQFQDQCWEV